MIDPQEGQIGYDIKEVYDEQTGILRMRQIELNGLLHSPPSDEPSHAAYDELGRPLLFEWHRFAESHRDQGPSSIYFNPTNGVACSEVYKINGAPRTAEFGPHVIHRDEETGEVVDTYTDLEWKEWSQSIGGIFGSLSPKP